MATVKGLQASGVIGEYKNRSLSCGFFSEGTSVFSDNALAHCCGI